MISNLSMKTKNQFLKTFLNFVASKKLFISKLTYSRLSNKRACSLSTSTRVGDLQLTQFYDHFQHNMSTDVILNMTVELSELKIT